MELADTPWPQLGGQVEVVILPTGSCEQHGPHLPFVTDTSIAVEVARRTVARLRAGGVHAALAPALSYGASGEHKHFPGTVDIGHKALYAILLEIGRSASGWADRLVIVNGHGGNGSTIAAAVARLRFEGRDAGWIPCDAASADSHAGRSETSLMAAIAGDTVRWDLAEPGVTDPLEVILPTLRTEGVAGVSSNGVLGDPAGATEAEGEQLLEGMVSFAVSAVRHGYVDEHGRLRVLVSA